jgi:hypothetical protein
MEVSNACSVPLPTERLHPASDPNLRTLEIARQRMPLHVLLLLRVTRTCAPCLEHSHVHGDLMSLANGLPAWTDGSTLFSQQSLRRHLP